MWNCKLIGTKLDGNVAFYVKTAHTNVDREISDYLIMCSTLQRSEGEHLPCTDMVGIAGTIHHSRWRYSLLRTSSSAWSADVNSVKLGINIC